MTGKHSHPRRPRRVPFFGGVLTALLLGLSFPPYEQRVLVWFALVPLFLSLDRHRHHARKRWLHGLSGGAILAVWLVSPLPESWVSGEASGEGPTASSLVSYVECGVVAAVVAAVWGLFAGLSGVLLGRGIWASLVGLPLLGTGLEVVRIEYLPVHVPWLALGEAISPVDPVSQIAALFGLYGVSLAIAFANSAFFCVIRHRTWRGQVLLATVGCATVLACHFYGSAVTPPKMVSGGLRAGLVQTPRGEAEHVLRLSSTILALGPRILFLPRLDSSPETPALETLRDLAAERGIEVVAGPAERTQDQERPAPAITLIDAEGGVQVVRLERQAEAASVLGGVLEAAAGRIGVVRGVDLHAPGVARDLSRHDVQFLLAVDVETTTSSCDLTRLEARRAAYRAVENRRWLLRWTAGGTQLWDAHGRAVAGRLPASEWALVETVEFTSERSFFSRAGWLLGPLSAAGALLFLAAAWLLPRRPPAPPDPRAELPPPFNA